MENFQKILAALPQKPGIYQFLDPKGTVLYVGKAKNLKRRVAQYAQSDAVSDKTRHMLFYATSLTTIETASEFDALLLEAMRIRDLQPKYNVIARDDKSPLYIYISLHDTLPRVSLMRKPHENSRKRDIYIGPFQSGKVARDLLRHLRRIVPFCTQKKRNGVPCFYTHIGLCDPCPSFIIKIADQDVRIAQTRLYRQNIRRLLDILTGKSTSIIHHLEQDMRKWADQNDFERAAHIRNQIHNLRVLLEKKYDPMTYITNPDMGERIGEDQTVPLIAALQTVHPSLHKLSRIECFDISNISGTSATGSMVVATDGIIDTSQYRKFRIRLSGRPNDAAMMAEMLTRRQNHPEWPVPDLVVVDGGKPQLHAAIQLTKETQGTPIIGLTKRREEIIVWNDGAFGTIRLPLTNPGLQLLQRLRDEAHRFAITYHRLLRKRRE
ncbi:GIY-YIG nuclease family protein [Candidatus Gottesmanbacteria bacterium]|nr:GIY-YIG nuclease family protein [Candidatus Gottesmanbacteria bacterium]